MLGKDATNTLGNIWTLMLLSYSVSKRTLNAGATEAADPSNQRNIPYIIHQTYRGDIESIPSFVLHAMQAFCTDCKVKWYSDDECLEFIREHYPVNASERYQSLKCGAHKADLFRYAVLYMYGGIYCDINLLPALHSSVHDVMDFSKPQQWYAVLQHGAQGIFQGFIATPARNPIFYDLMNQIMTVGDAYITRPSSSCSSYASIYMLDAMKKMYKDASKWEWKLFYASALLCTKGCCDYNKCQGMFVSKTSTSQNRPDIFTTQYDWGGGGPRNVSEVLLSRFSMPLGVSQVREYAAEKFSQNMSMQVPLRPKCPVDITYPSLKRESGIEAVGPPSGGKLKKCSWVTLFYSTPGYDTIQWQKMTIIMLLSIRYHSHLSCDYTIITNTIHPR